MPKQSPAEAHELALTRRKITSSFVDVGVELAIHRFDVIFETTLLQGAPELRIRRLTGRVEVFSQSSFL